MQTLYLLVLKIDGEDSTDILGVFDSADKALEASQSVRQNYRTDSADIRIIKQTVNKLSIPFWMAEK